MWLIDHKDNGQNVQDQARTMRPADMTDQVPVKSEYPLVLFTSGRKAILVFDGRSDMNASRV